MSRREKQRANKAPRSLKMTPPSLDHFTCFVDLPAELRLKIWEFARPLPRIVELSWDSKTRSLVSLTTPPAVLSVCSESRGEFIANYDVVDLGKSPQTILVDPNRDTIFFGPGCKHMTPSGKTDPWIELNRKVVRDIISSRFLTWKLAIAAFESEFLVALQASQELLKLIQLHGGMKAIEKALIIKGQAWQDAKDKVRYGSSSGLRFQDYGRTPLPRAHLPYAVEIGAASMTFVDVGVEIF